MKTNDKIKFQRWKSDFENKFCAFKYMYVEEQDEIDNGISVLDSLSEEILCEARDYDKLNQLADNLYGTGYPVVSDKLKSFLEKKIDSKHIEFLPVTLIDQQKRNIPGEYYLINALRVVDCIDIEASGVVWNPLEPSEIMHYEKGLELQESKIPENLKLFRLKKHSSTIIVRSDLVTEIEQTGFSGLYFPDAKGYMGVG
ncbi:imm11 family protein [Aquimarina mytili]|uniref:Immunity MXAN-0049 protein domain-containing protein n=1 Tax=Aquimarina mytili TaxID=874423 RepID=A0A937D4Z8_9FLAO|nr:DUF1629 domain-containing protein [Aquimarina mytili]MBL0682749.1 hypothetical protein [Aquimarina mytili]